MHRSGTSLTAGVLAAGHLPMGDRMVPPDPRNAKGYFEDAAFVDFHRRAFAGILRRASAGHVDWGWAPDRTVESEDLCPFRQDAQALVADRSDAHAVWGFKDPRTTLVLEFWDALLPDAAYVAVYRSPALVADSMQRLGADVFLRHPEYAWAIWHAYNQRLLAFVQQHRHRCVLLNVESLTTAPRQVLELLQSKFGLTFGPDTESCAIAPDLLQRTSALHAQPAVCRGVWPHCYELFDALESLADLPGSGMGRSADHPVLTASASRPEAAPAVSIVIPTFNDATLAVEALASITLSSAESCEVLIMDDGSTDAESHRILHCLRTLGHTVLQQPHAGLSAARNALIARARGRLVLPLDADNRLVPGFLERALAVLATQPDTGVVYGDIRRFGSEHRLREQPDYALADLVRWNTIDACAMFRRDLWSDVGGYDEQLDGFEDWEFWLHAGARGWRFQHLPGVAFEYRVRPQSLVTRCNTPLGRLRIRRRLLQKHPAVLWSFMPTIATGWLGSALGSGVGIWSRTFWRLTVLTAYWHTHWALSEALAFLHRHAGWLSGTLGRAWPHRPSPSYK